MKYVAWYVGCQDHGIASSSPQFSKQSEAEEMAVAMNKLKTPEDDACIYRAIRVVRVKQFIYDSCNVAIACSSLAALVSKQYLLSMALTISARYALNLLAESV